MDTLATVIADHPIRNLPYSAIRLSHCDGNGTPIYVVEGTAGTGGAPRAMKIAFARFGAECFHCGKDMPPQTLSHDCTRDHVRASSDNGSNLLHNLVFACGGCNSRKGRANIVSFNVERGADYLRLLDEHITRCIAALRAPVRSITSG